MASRSRWRSYGCGRCSESTRAISGTERDQAGLCRTCFGKREDKRPRELNELSGSEWARLSRSVEQFPDVRSEKQRIHGASFPQSLAEAHISMYTKTGATVLDPFVGVGTTVDACEQLGRVGIGCDVNEEFLALAQAGLPDASESRYINADARSLTDYLDAESVDFVFTSPPYGSLLRNVKGAFAYKWQEHSTIGSIPNPRPYSDLPEDLGNFEYPEFLEAIELVLSQTFTVQREGSYAAWVVKDFRASKEGVPFVNYHGHFIDRAERAGFTLWDLRIWDQTKFRPLVCLGYPSRNYYLNISHSYVVVLRKR